MRIGVMQPYFFPYLGYFHLMNAVDIFVVLDDVQYSKGGWVNRNRVLIQGKPAWLTVPISSVGKSIQEKSYLVNPKWHSKLRRTLYQAYPDAPGLTALEAILDEWMSSHHMTVSETNMWLINRILDTFCEKSPEFRNVSSLGLEPGLRGVDKVLTACKALGGGMYVNLPGGRSLYSSAEFEEVGVELRFVSSRFPRYPQQFHDFIPGLSILDMVLQAPERLAVATGPEHYNLVSEND